MRKRKGKYIDTRKWYRYQFFGSAKVKIIDKNKEVDATIANISFSGIGLYATSSIGKGKKVEIRISFIDRRGKLRENKTTGTVDWQAKIKNTYLVGILFDEELNVINQPVLVDHLIWLINTYKWPQPYKNKRISML